MIGLSMQCLRFCESEFQKCEVQVRESAKAMTGVVDPDLFAADFTF